MLFEKRRLEKELKNRDIEVEELSDQVIEKESELKKLGNNYASYCGFYTFLCFFFHKETKLEECRRKIAELIGYRDKAFEYDSIIEKYLNYEKENVNHFEKIKNDL